MVDIDPTHSPDPGDPDVDFEPEHDEPDLDESGDDPDEGEVGADAPTPAMGGGDMPPIPRPINWRTLSSDDAEHEWLALNEWVNWLRHEFALPAQIIPPMWHRHPELVWELSALHTRWLGCYDPEQDAAGPISFMTDFAAARTRLREWVQISGTRLDRDRPTRQTTWPGEDPAPASDEVPITDRDADFIDFVMDDVARRAAAENAFLLREEHP
ncbi:hypothetical protein [Microbacterium sp. UBA1097]|uniref:hypothetical protein n=1 Tax=uncultured Microbacterium sp. TaxID=191216 RepID=UPI0025EF9B65|nr:hypothetical protein [Microbacterium sp. UBA1097]